MKPRPTGLAERLGLLAVVLVDEAARHHVGGHRPVGHRRQPERRAEHGGGERLARVGVVQLGRERHQHDQREEERLSAISVRSKSRSFSNRLWWITQKRPTSANAST